MTQASVGSGALVHIAGPDIQVGARLRQRCAWCGALIIDYDLARTASPCGDDCRASGCKPENHRPGTWPVGGLVEIDGAARWTVPHEDGAQLPANACAQLDDEVTS
jgi:hypothetical protein